MCCKSQLFQAPRFPRRETELWGFAFGSSAGRPSGPRLYIVERAAWFQACDVALELPSGNDLLCPSLLGNLSLKFTLAQTMQRGRRRKDLNLNGSPATGSQMVRPWPGQEGRARPAPILPAPPPLSFLHSRGQRFPDCGGVFMLLFCKYLHFYLS